MSALGPMQTIYWAKKDPNKESESEYVNRCMEYNLIEARLMGHLELLIESGYIQGIEVIRGMDGSMHYAMANPRLTMDGHDLLDTMRSSTIWESIKATAKSKGIELTFDAIKALSGLALKHMLG